jgi:hypothetical protein
VRQPEAGERPSDEEGLKSNHSGSSSPSAKDEEKGVMPGLRRGGLARGGGGSELVALAGGGGAGLAGGGRGRRA